MVMMVAGFSAPVQAQEDYASRRAAAEGQFERAETARATLEAKTERERSLQGPRVSSRLHLFHKPFLESRNSRL